MMDELPNLDDAEESVEDEEGTPEPASSLGKLGRASRSRIARKKDVVICITGDEGEGKTTLAIKAGKEIDKKFDLKRNVLFDPSVSSLHEMIYGLPVGAAIVIDELMRIGYARNWATKENKFLNELYVLSRFQRKASIFCIPRFGLIDKDLRPRILFWIHVIERGVAVIMRRDKNQFAKDVWHFTDNDKMLRALFHNKPIHEFGINDYVNAVSRSPNFVDVITFDAMTEEEERQYDDLKKPYELKLKEAEDDPRLKKASDALARCVAELIKQGWTQDKIAALTERSPSHLRSILKKTGIDATEVRLEAREEKKRKRTPKEFDALPVELLK